MWKIIGYLLLIGLVIYLFLQASYLLAAISLAISVNFAYKFYKVIKQHKKNPTDEINYKVKLFKSESEDSLYDVRKALAVSLISFFILLSIGNSWSTHKKNENIKKQQIAEEQARKKELEEKARQEEIRKEEEEEKKLEDNARKLIGKAKVKETTDGDTIVITIADKDYKLRMIGIDTPETKHPEKPVEFMGQEASNFTHNELYGKEVWLEKDVSETDKYQRLLRYIWLEDPETIKNPTYEDIRDKTFNGILLKEGYAKASSYPPDVKYQEYFTKIQQEAEQNKKGLWQDRIEEPEPDNSNSDGQSQTSDVVDMRIKGNRNSKIYHFPGGRSYDKVKESNAVYFKTPEEAEAAGYRPAKR